MNEQVQTIIDRARVLLAAATPLPWVSRPGVDGSMSGRRLHAAVGPAHESGNDTKSWNAATAAAMADAEALAFAVNNTGTLCNAVVDAERRAEKAEAQAADRLMFLEGISLGFPDGEPRIFSHLGMDRESLIEFGRRLDAIRDITAGDQSILDRLTAAETRVADLESVREEQAAKLRRHLDEIAEMGALHSVAEARERRLERELLAVWATVRPDNPAPTTERDVLHAVEDVQSDAVSLRAIIADCAAAIGNGSACSKDASVEFMAMIPAEIHAEIVALRDRAGIAEGREACAKANAAEMAGRLDAQNAGLAQMARDRDALRVKLDAAEAKVARLEARTVRRCEVCNGHGAIRLAIDDGQTCDTCDGSGAVIVEGTPQPGVMIPDELPRVALVQGEWKKRPAGTVPWIVFLEAFDTYRKKFGNGQSAERIAERGGFSYREMQCLLAGHYSHECKADHEPVRGWVEKLA